MSVRRLLGFREGDEVSFAPVLPPFLLALFSVLGLVVQNPDSGIRAGNLVVPFGLAAGVAGIGWLGSRLLSGDADRRGLLAMLFVVAVLYFGYLAGPPTDLLERAGVPGSGLASAVVAVLMGSSGIWIVRTRRDLSSVTRFANATLITLLVMAGIQGRGMFIGLVMGGHPGYDGKDAFTHAEPTSSRDTDPDIFFIVLDAYSSPDALSRIYGLDVGYFIEELEELGFSVPRRSRANYVATFLSVAAMLDWDYISGLTERTNRSDIYPLLHDNATTRFLRHQGYEVVFFRSSYPPLNSSPVANRHVPLHLPGEFEARWVRHTLLSPILGGVCRVFGCGSQALPFAAEGPAAHKWRFHEIGQTVRGDRPLFVYAHILLPHEPFIFGRECDHLAPMWPDNIDVMNEALVRLRYQVQVVCLNDLVLNLARELVARDPPPIILFQSDHGYGRFGWGQTTPLREASEDQVWERFSITSAYYLPGEEADTIIYDSITPINVFRRTFSHYFDLHLEPREDISLWSSWSDPFAFTTVD